MSIIHGSSTYKVQFYSHIDVGNGIPVKDICRYVCDRYKGIHVMDTKVIL